MGGLPLQALQVSMDGWRLPLYAVTGIWGNLYNTVRTGQSQFSNWVSAIRLAEDEDGIYT